MTDDTRNATPARIDEGDYSMALTTSELRAFTSFVRAGWEKAAEAYHRHWGSLSQQSAGAMLDAAEVASGTRMLDVATGAGYVAALAKRRGAQPVGLDFSEAQVKLARSTYPDVEFRRGDAQALPFEAEIFDAVAIGFGLNHLPEPEQAFREAFRVLRSGGRMAFTVWAAPKQGEGFGIVLGAITVHGVPDPSLPPAPPYFRFADAAETHRVFASAGFIASATRIVPQFWRHSTPDEVFAAFNEGAVRATAMLRAQPPDRQQAIRRIVRREVEQLGANGEYVIPVPAALSWARKP